MMLEDDFSDVIRKALKGLALSPGEASSRSGIPLAELHPLIRGRFSGDHVRDLAPVLGLNAQALATLSHYAPAPLDLVGIERFDLPFHDARVNAWLLRKDSVNILFDTGLTFDSCAAALDKLGVDVLDAVLISHSHPDHIGGLDGLRPRIKAIYAPAFDRVEGANPTRPGDCFNIGPITITAMDLAGHCDGALGYLIEGFDRPVCMVGDALFAGSIGGCSGPESYQVALQNLRREVMGLPDNAVLLPGHGPATTVGEEKMANPFVAAP